MAGLIKRFFNIAIQLFALAACVGCYFAVVEGPTVNLNLYNAIFCISMILSFSFMLMLMIYGPAFCGTLFWYPTWWQHRGNRMSTLLELWRQDFSRVDKEAFERRFGILAGILEVFGYFLKWALYLGLIGLTLGLIGLTLWISVSIVRWMWEHAIGL